MTITLGKLIGLCKYVAERSPLGIDTCVALCEEDREYVDFKDITIDIDESGGATMLMSLHQIRDEPFQSLRDRLEKPFSLEMAKKLRWGTYGPQGEDDLKWTTLGECDTEHLKNILRTQHQISKAYVMAIFIILTDRGCSLKELTEIYQR